MGKKVSGVRVATGNRLDTGQVVFFGVDGTWVSNLNAARLACTDADAAALERDAARAADSVIAPYLIEVETKTGTGPVPVAHRERMRTAGPSVGHSLNYAPRMAATAA